MNNRALDDVTSKPLIFFQIMARQTKTAKLKFHLKTAIHGIYSNNPHTQVINASQAVIGVPHGVL